MRYARKTVGGVRVGGGSKSKRKGKPRTNKPVALWKPCNAAHDSRGAEFINGTRTRRQIDNGEIPRGHVHLPGCDCLNRADWPDGYSEEYRGIQASKKAHDKRVQAHEETGARCPGCFLLLPLGDTLETHTCW